MSDKEMKTLDMITVVRTHMRNNGMWEPKLSREDLFSLFDLVDALAQQRDGLKAQLADATDATRPKPKPPIQPTPHITPDYKESRLERLAYNVGAALLIIILACLAVLAVWLTWQIVTSGCTLLRK